MTFGGRRRIALRFPQDRSASHADGAVRCQPQKWCCFSVSKSFCSIKQGLFRAFLSPLHLAHIFSEDHQDAEFRASSRCQNLCSQPCSARQPRKHLRGRLLGDTSQHQPDWPRAACWAHLLQTAAGRPRKENWEAGLVTWTQRAPMT